MSIFVDRPVRNLSDNLQPVLVVRTDQVCVQYRELHAGAPKQERPERIIFVNTIQKGQKDHFERGSWGISTRVENRGFLWKENCCKVLDIYIQIFFAFLVICCPFPLQKPQYNGFLSQGINLFAGSGQSHLGPAKHWSRPGHQLPGRWLPTLERWIMGVRADRQKLRQVYNGHFIANVDVIQERANRLIAAGTVDSVAFARPYIANPDLAERFLTSAPLSEINWPTVYASGPKGYIDYPTLLTTLSDS